MRIDLSRRDFLCFFAASLGLITFHPGLALAQSPTEKALLARWQTLQPEFKKLVIANWKKFKALPEDRQAILISRLNRFLRMKPHEQRNVRATYAKFYRRPLSRRQLTRGQYFKFMRLPAEDRKRILEIREKQKQSMPTAPKPAPKK